MPARSTVTSASADLERRFHEDMRRLPDLVALAIGDELDGLLVVVAPAHLSFPHHVKTSGRSTWLPLGSRAVACSR